MFIELQKISSHYQIQLPFELKFDNILNFESILQINCQSLQQKKNYFISIPINYEKQFELYYLHSLPT